jgi:hypothetical protein
MGREQMLHEMLQGRRDSTFGQESTSKLWCGSRGWGGGAFRLDFVSLCAPRVIWLLLNLLMVDA